MKRLSLTPAKQTIALLIFMAAYVLPSYGQEVQTIQRVRAAQNTSEETSEELKPGNAKSLEEAVSTDEHKSGAEVDSSQSGTSQTANQTPYVFPTKRERFNRYVKSTFGPFSFLSAAISGGIDQWRDRPEEWEQGASGYGKRFASSFGRMAIQQTAIYGLDTAMHLDTGFRRSSRKGFLKRMTDALAENITSRTRTGKRVISVPRISGVYASGMIAETWYPARYDYKDGLRIGTRSLLTGFGVNLIREFVITW